MFRKRALQELTDIVATTGTPAATPEDSSDPKVMTVQRIHDLLREVGVDPGDDPVEAARTFLASADNKLPSSFGAFRLGRGKGDRHAPPPAHEEVALSTPAPAEFAAAEPPAGDIPFATEAPFATETVVEPAFADAEAYTEPPAFDATAFEAAGFEPGVFESEPPVTPVAETEPVEAVVFDDGGYDEPWEPIAEVTEDDLPEWVRERASEPAVDTVPDVVSDVATPPVAALDFDTVLPSSASSASVVSAGSSDELAAANARIEELQSAVIERAVQRDAIREELEVTEGRVRQLETDLAQRESEHETLAARVAELELAAAQARHEVSETQRALQEAQYATERAVIESADLSTLEFKGELAPTFEELAAAIAALETTLAIREREHAEVHSRIAEQEASIAELTAQRNDAFATIANARERERELNDALTSARDELAGAADDQLNAEARRAELASLQAELDRAEASLRNARANEVAANDELDRRRSELGDVQHQLVAVRDALRIATTECEATERRVAIARAQASEAETARDGARAEAERVIELAMRQAQALRADAERQAESARILNDAAHEAITLQADAQRQADVVRDRATQAAEAIRAERTTADSPESEQVAPAILSALISRVAAIESHLAQHRDRVSTTEEHDELEDASITD
jgi:hypothetical protein